MYSQKLILKRDQERIGWVLRGTGFALHIEGYINLFLLLLLTHSHKLSKPHISYKNLSLVLYKYFVGKVILPYLWFHFPCFPCFKMLAVARMPSELLCEVCRSRWERFSLGICLISSLGNKSLRADLRVWSGMWHVGSCCGFLYLSFFSFGFFFVNSFFNYSWPTLFS